MSLWSALQIVSENDKDLRAFGRKVQRVTAFSVAALLAASASVLGRDILIFAIWFAFTGFWPFILGRFVATCMFILALVAIVYVEGSFASRLTVLVGSLPFLVVAGILWKRQFAALVGAMTIQAFESVVAPKS